MFEHPLTGYEQLVEEKESNITPRGKELLGFVHFMCYYYDD